MSSTAMFATRSFIVLSLLVGSAAVLRAQTNAQSTAQPAAASPDAPLARDQRRVSYTVAARAIARGETLRAEDIAMLDTVIVWRWNGSPDTTRALPGWVTRRAIAAGEVLRAPAVGAPALITSGQTVTAIWQDGSLRLAIAGVATNTAALGAPVGVRIDRSRRLDGVAVGPNTVRLR
ncbi:MAG: flagellar basal body P-ring formation protein FlgA [Gemmatimonadaceae bacterium]|nr:flagellar basal body P-ring formation protein FlgA [Gemmatimonadaceae bacterium]